MQKTGTLKNPGDKPALRLKRDSEKLKQPLKLTSIKPDISKKYLEDSQARKHRGKRPDLAGGPYHVMDNPV